jgi:hypothetical protein
VYDNELKSGIEKTKGYRVPHLPKYPEKAIVTA